MIYKGLKKKQLSAILKTPKLQGEERGLKSNIEQEQGSENR